MAVKNLIEQAIETYTRYNAASAVKPRIERIVNSKPYTEQAVHSTLLGLLLLTNGGFMSFMRLQSRTNTRKDRQMMWGAGSLYDVFHRGMNTNCLSRSIARGSFWGCVGKDLLHTSVILLCIACLLHSNHVFKGYDPFNKPWLLIIH